MRETYAKKMLPWSSVAAVAAVVLVALLLMPGAAVAAESQVGGSDPVPQVASGDVAETTDETQAATQTTVEGAADAGLLPAAGIAGGETSGAAVPGDGNASGDADAGAVDGAPNANAPEAGQGVEGEGGLEDAGQGQVALSGADGEAAGSAADGADVEPADDAVPQQDMVSQSEQEHSATGTAAAQANVAENKVAAKASGSAAAKTATTAKATVNAKDEEEAPQGSISYRAHVANIGWMGYVGNGKTAGGISADEQLEAIQVKLSGVGGSIAYQAYAKGKGWISASNNKTAGTTGQALAVQALRARLTGEASTLYDLYYRVYVDDLGWLGWAKNNAKAGSVDFDRPLQGVQFRLVDKGGAKPAKSGSVTSVAYIPKPKVSVRTHVQNIGWQNAVGNGKVAGTSGRALRMEAVRISITGSGVSGGATYRTHVQNVGWQKYVKNGATAGTSGRALRLEALNLDLTSEMAKCYDVFYRTHVQNVGWMNWSMDDELSGTTGRALRLEAIQVKVTLKGGSPSDGTYIYLDAGHGWGDGHADSGAVGSGYREADLTQELVGKIAKYAKDDYGLDVYNNSGCKINFTGRQNDAMNRGCTSFVSIHFNAGGGSGSESYAYTSLGKQLQGVIHPYLISGTALRDRGAKTYGYNVVAGPVPAVLLEVCFIDTASDMRQYQARKETIAKQIAKGLYEASRRGF